LLPVLRQLEKVRSDDQTRLDSYFLAYHDGAKVRKQEEKEKAVESFPEKKLGCRAMMVVDRSFFMTVVR
jgi:hypothetical protein